MAPSTSSFNINQLSEKVETEHEINIISSSSEEDYDTDELVDNSIDRYKKVFLQDQIFKKLLILRW